MSAIVQAVRSSCFTLQAAALLLMPLSGCVASAKPPEPSPTSLPAPNALPDTPLSSVFSEGTWRTLHSREHGITLSLPDASQWRLLKDRTWLSVAHRATESQLLVKHWNQGKLVDPKDCEAQALLWKAAFVRPTVAAISEQRLALPTGYQGRQWTYAVEGRSGSVQGRVLFYSANIRDCVAVQFTTEARGPHAANVVAVRLSQVSERFLPSISIHSVDERVKRE